MCTNDRTSLYPQITLEDHRPDFATNTLFGFELDFKTVPVSPSPEGLTGEVKLKPSGSETRTKIPQVNKIKLNNHLLLLKYAHGQDQKEFRKQETFPIL